MDTRSDLQWVADRLATIAPAWEPDAARARMRFADARPAPRRAWTYGLATAAAAVALAVAMPSGRTLAKELWTRWFVTRVAVTRLDASRIPMDTSIRTDASITEAASGDEAAAIAGFPIFLPAEALAGGAPALRVIGRFDVTQTIRTARLEEGLRRHGVADVEVPAAWDGVTLHGAIGPIVAATYPGGVEVLQAPPVRIDVPADFPLATFLTTLFQAGGIPRHEAQPLAEELAARPAWLLDQADDGSAVIETVTLPGGGSGLLVETDDEGTFRSTLIVSRPTRIYTVATPTRGRTLAIAAALP